jgi:hypothetical protein
MQSPQQEQENASWWKDLITDPPCEIGETMRIETFSRNCYKLFFNEKLSKARYFHACSVVCMVKLCTEEDVSPRRVWKSVVRCFQQHNDNDNRSSTIASWILPSMEPIDLQSDIDFYSQSQSLDNEDDDEDDDNMRSMHSSKIISKPIRHPSGFDLVGTSLYVPWSSYGWLNNMALRNVLLPRQWSMDFWVLLIIVVKWYKFCYMTAHHTVFCIQRRRSSM